MVYDFGQVYTPRKAFNRFKGVEECCSSARGDASDSFVLDNIAIVYLVVQKDWFIVETCLAIQFFQPA